MIDISAVQRGEIPAPEIDRETCEAVDKQLGLIGFHKVWARHGLIKVIDKPGKEAAACKA